MSNSACGKLDKALHQKGLCNLFDEVIRPATIPFHQSLSRVSLRFLDCRYQTPSALQSPGLLASNPTLCLSPAPRLFLDNSSTSQPPPSVFAAAVYAAGTQHISLHEVIYLNHHYHHHHQQQADSPGCPLYCR